jgi:AcrR family transcriptional regulator
VRENRLTEDDIVASALRLIEGEGIDRLSMRRLAEDLGVSAMAIYYYVRSKEELLSLAADRVISQIVWEDTGTWQQRVLAHATLTWEVLTQYPGLAAYLLNRPLSEQARQSIRRFKDLLEEAGCDPDTAALAFDAYHVYSYGTIAMDTHFDPKGRSHAARRRIVVFGLQTWIAGLEAHLAQPERPAS